MFKKILLQVKFILIEIFSILYRVIPSWTIRKFYLRIFNIKIGRKTAIHNVRFFNFGNIEIGDNSTINRGCYLDNRRKITIGDNVSIAHNVKVYTYGHDIDCDHFSTIGSSVTIEDYVCIFANAMIMPGVTISKGAVVLAGAIVVKDVGPYDVVGGNPAKFIRKRKSCLNYELDYRYFFGL